MYIASNFNEFAIKNAGIAASKGLGEGGSSVSL